MKCISVLRALVVLLILITSHSKIKAQYNLGVEAGATMSSLFADKQDPTNAYAPKVGARAGLFVERELTTLFSLKTGAYYELKGASQPNSPASKQWNLHYASVPLLLEVRPIESLTIGLGVEGHVLLHHDIPVMEPSRFNVGLRAEAAWQISKAFRVQVYGGLDLLSTTNFYVTDEQGQVLHGNKPVHFRNISAGLGLTYIIKSFDKK